MPSVIRGLVALHIFLYRLSEGRIGGQLGSNPILLLHTVGRKSGRSHITPLVYLADGENLIIAASNNGSDRHPGWYYNLRATPQTSVTVRELTLSVTAELAVGRERDRLWAALTGRHRQFLGYQAKTERQIPLVVLKPAG